MLAEHRVLTTPALTALAFPSPRAATGRLRTLWQWELTDRFQPYTLAGSAPLHHVLGPAGAAVIAAEEGLDPTQLGYRRDRTLGIAHSLQLAHTVAVNDLLAHLAAHPPQPGWRMPVWWSAARCHRHIGDIVRPDAYLHLTHHHGQPAWPEAGPGSAPVVGFEAFLEYDFGTTSGLRVAEKLDRYHHLATLTAVSTPLLVWCPSRRRERGLRTHLARAHAALAHPDLVPVATASPPADQDDPPSTAATAATAAAAAPVDGGVGGWATVWQPLTGPSRRPEHHLGLGGRIGLADLVRIWPLRRHPPGRALLGSHGLTSRPDNAARRPPLLGFYGLPAPAPTPPGPRWDGENR
jgi:hypothetical protein